MYCTYVLQSEVASINYQRFIDPVQFGIVMTLASMIGLLSGNVFVRYVPMAAFYWFDEVVEWTFAWMVFFGAADLWARYEHFKLDWINKKNNGNPGRASRCGWPGAHFAFFLDNIITLILIT